MNTTAAEIVGSTLSDVRKDAPSVGLAALSGKTPNTALRAAWEELNSIGVQLQKSNMNYKWRALHDVNPKLGHAIEEVLVFGDALFSAWGKRQTPDGLKQEYIDLKQRFSKIIKETETIAAPKEEKKLFSFFEKPQSEAQKTELKLNQLDTLLEEAHEKSRVLLGKTEKDLSEERAFHKATEWYILALHKATENLDKLLSEKNVSTELVGDLGNALRVSSGTTSAILATTDQWLRVKEELHNKSITFLTAHENTFTIIQGHLRSWKDIKNQTEALNALNQAVQMGTSLMSTASNGVEQPMSKWSAELITPDTLKKLSNSFNEYDKDVNALVSDLVAPKNPGAVQLSRWDNWPQTKRDLLDPILAQGFEGPKTATTENLRPVLKTDKDKQSVVSDEDGLAMLDKIEVEPVPVLPQVFKKHPPRLLRSNQPKPVSNWNRLETKMAERNITIYRKATGSSFDLTRADDLGWSSEDIAANLLSPIRVLGADIEELPIVIKSEIDYLIQSKAVQLIDWQRVADQEVIPFGKNWSNDFSSWMKKHDDLDWSYLMQWNELVYDLLILDQDQDQKNSLQQEEGASMLASIKERIEEFLDNPNLSSDVIKSWGFAGIITRYAMAFDFPVEKINKGWSYFSNPVQPVDWDGRPVSDWPINYPKDCQSPSAVEVLKNIDDGFTVVSQKLSSPEISSEILMKKKAKKEKKEVEKEVDSVSRRRL